MIEKHGSQVVVFGSLQDRDITEKVQQHARHALINLAGQTSLAETIALIAQCRLFISNDSGLMHVAGALNIPTVAIFGSTNPSTTSPVGDSSVVIYKGVPCSPCLKEVCPTDFRCMDAIRVDDVDDAATRLLKNLL
jgi:heptosyltransferase-2